ncbi:trigger factor [Ilumatobacter nonamiensis]|uniref:trigger factor n=1 Tax=Ilumatobacter nonamiensis TaxID=467093 RepID=UPI000344A59D|nr:trigger factor [Ilumatobacter nonamiensis]
MKSSVEVLEDNKVKVYVEVDEAEFDKDIDKAFKLLAKEVNLPGFRAGKVPRKVLEARVGLGPAREQALRDAVPEYLSKAVNENDVDLIATPEVEITDGEETGPVEFEATCEVRPVITVEGYDSLKVELPSVEVTDDDVTEAQNAELSRDASLTAVERPAETGDFLLIDMAATRDGEEVSGLNTEDFSYELGQGWVTDDFDEQLTGASAGDTLEFESTPKGLEDPVDFVVTVQMVQTRELPELTDEWVEENIEDFETAEAWTESLRETLSEQKLSTARQQAGTKINDALAELVDIEVPEPMVANDLNQRVQGTIQQFQAQGIDFEQWMQATGQDPESFVEGMRGQSETAVKVDLALRAITVAESIEASDDEIEREYARLAMQYEQKAKDIRRAYEQNDAVSELVSQIQKSKAFDFLVHHATYVDENGNEMDRDALIGHSEHDHDHDDSTEDVDAEAAAEPDTAETQTETAESDTEDDS